MFRKKCNFCGEKIKKDFNFCPKCGNSLDDIKKENYGLIGLNDSEPIFNDYNSPIENFLNKAMKNIMKDFFNNINDLQENKNTVHNIKISLNFPNEFEEKVEKKDREKIILTGGKITEEKKKLPIVEAKYKMKRLAEEIVYEIEAPGVKSNEDVSILKIENGIEVRAYSNDKCYIKNIPVNSNAIKFSVKNNKVFVQLKN